MPNEESLQTQLEQALSKLKELENSNASLLLEKSKYENGDAKLYYSIQRKLSEMAISLNSQSLEGVDFASKSDATFERVFKLLEKAESVANASKALGIAAGITGDELADINRKPFTDRIAVERK
jgi:hypothetical protein